MTRKTIKEHWATLDAQIDWELISKAQDGVHSAKKTRRDIKRVLEFVINYAVREDGNCSLDAGGTLVAYTLQNDSAFIANKKANVSAVSDWLTEHAEKELA